MSTCIKLHNVWQEKSRFIKNQKVSELLRKLAIRTPLRNIALIGDTLFEGSCFVLIIFEILIK